MYLFCIYFKKCKFCVYPCKINIALINKTVVMCRYLKRNFSRTILHSLGTFTLHYCKVNTIPYNNSWHQNCQEVTCSEDCCLFVVWLNFQIRTEVLSWGGSCAFLKDSCSCLKMHSFLPTSSPSSYDVTLVPLALLALWWCNTNRVVIQTIKKEDVTFKREGNCCSEMTGLFNKEVCSLRYKIAFIISHLVWFHLL